MLPWSLVCALMQPRNQIWIKGGIKNSAVTLSSKQLHETTPSASQGTSLLVLHTHLDCQELSGLAEALPSNEAIVRWCVKSLSRTEYRIYWSQWFPLSFVKYLLSTCYGASGYSSEQQRQALLKPLFQRCEMTGKPSANRSSHCCAWVTVKN